MKSTPTTAENALFLVLRHAETESNTRGVWHGGQDEPIAQAARKATEIAANRLVSLVKSDHVGMISSDLRRAMETTEILRAALHVDIVAFDPLLRERDMGQWAGMSPAEVERISPGAFSAWESGLSEGPPGGETDKDVAARALASLTRHAVQGETINVVVTHGGVIRSVSYILTGQKPPVPHLAGYWVTRLPNGEFVMGEKVILGDPSVKPRT